MSIQDPKSISVSGSVADLLAQVDETLLELNKRRPFPARTEDSLRRSFLPDRITATLNIEGIGVTRRETLAIMEAMTVSSNASREEKEILNALHADDFIYEAVNNKIGVDPSFVRRINELILLDVHNEAGVFRKNDVEISGAAFIPPSHVDVPSLIQDLCDNFPASEFIHPLMQAAWLHNQFTYIHPFLDGNGRTARLLQDYCLLNRGLYPVGVPTKRDDYYSALQLADEGKWDELVELIALAELSLISKVDAITREPEKKTAWITQLAKAASAKKTGTLHKQYLVWRSRMELVRESFLTTANEIESSSDVIGVSQRTYDIIEFEKWRQIGDHGSADRTWAFSLLFFADGVPFYKVIGFFRRHRVEPMDPYHSADGLVSMAITGQDAQSRDRPNFYAYQDPQIRLREMLYLDDQFIAYQQQIGQQMIVPSDGQSLDDVVRNFFEDVFYRKAAVGA
jgi:Fic family protein